MIPGNYIQEWSHTAPWQDSYQIEQDLVISKALVEIFADPFLNENLAFRGGQRFINYFWISLRGIPKILTWFRLKADR
ncbi:MAG TPA: hypothetical protein VD884_03575 [Ohtaekwangia sp.]|nr:hypothetical protein [Ohtaekwangia sp.]